MRDKRVSPDYYNNYLAYYALEIKEGEEETQESSDNPSLDSFLCLVYFKYAMGLYSKGEKIPVVMEWIRKSIFLINCNIDVPFITCNLLYDLAAFSCVFGTETDKRILSDFYKNVHYKNGFLNLVLLGEEKPDKNSDKIYALINEIKGRDDTEKVIEEYCKKKWYQTKKKFYWYNSHLDLNDFNYFGYWAFDVAAVLKYYDLPFNDIHCENYPIF